MVKNTEWKIGDVGVFNGTKWQKVKPEDIFIEVEKEKKRIIKDIKKVAEPYENSKWYNKLDIETIIKIINNKND